MQYFHIPVAYMGVTEQVQCTPTTTREQFIELAKEQFGITRDGWRLVFDDGYDLLSAHHILSEVFAYAASSQDKDQLPTLTLLPLAFK